MVDEGIQLPTVTSSPVAGFVGYPCSYGSANRCPEHALSTQPPLGTPDDFE